MANVGINLRGAYDKLSPQAVQKGQRAVANQAMADMNAYVPMKEGILRMTTTLGIDGSSINYNTPYAAAQFYAPGGWNYTTPGTGPRWDLKAQANHMRDWERAFREGAGW